MSAQPLTVHRIAKDPNGQLKTNLFPVIRPTGTYQENQKVQIEFNGHAVFAAQVVATYKPMALAEIPKLVWMICTGSVDTEPARRAYASSFHAANSFTIYLLQRL